MEKIYGCQKKDGVVILTSDNKKFKEKKIMISLLPEFKRFNA